MVGVYFRTDAQEKTQAEAILKAMGIPPAVALRMFYHQVIATNGLPFRPQLSRSTLPLDLSALSTEEIDEEFEKAETAIDTGKTKPAKKVFSEIRSRYEKV